MPRAQSCGWNVDADRAIKAPDPKPLYKVKPAPDSNRRPLPCRGERSLAVEHVWMAGRVDLDLYNVLLGLGGRASAAS
jgi:hypothetical protein